MSPRLAYASQPTVSLALPRKQIWAPATHRQGFVSTADAAAFGPREHVAALHPGNKRTGPLAGRRDGDVVFGQRVPHPEKPWRQWSVGIGEAAWTAEKLVAEGVADDLYFSQNAFRRRRCLAQLQALGACYVDLDFHSHATHAQKSPRWVAEGVLLALDDAGRPAPSYLLRTGRGLCAVWLTETLPRAALPRWAAVQKQLAEGLTSFGADKRALDAVRVFRVAGSTNSRADPDDPTVRLIWCQGDPSSPFRHVFDDLANETLPHTRPELRSLAVERAKRKSEREAQGRPVGRPARALSAGTWAETMLTDLQRLQQHRYGEGSIRVGERDNWLFCAATAMAWLAPPEAFESELAALADEAAGWQGRQTRSRLGSAIRRARDAAAGNKVMWNGKEIDPRYRMRASTVIEWLEIAPDEQRAAGLRMLVDPDRRRELDADRKRMARARDGAKSRAEAQAERLMLGRKALYLHAKDGMNRAELAAHFSVSTGLISKAMDAARKAF